MFFALSVGTPHVQQVFLTGDADTSAKHYFHLELRNEYDRVQDIFYPMLRQNTSRFQLTFGILNNLEIGFDEPLILIRKDKSMGNPDVLGPGDLNLQVKYRLRDEHPNSRLPAITFGLYIEVPTGNSRNQLGSGIADYWLNVILQKSITKRITIRLNSGILFSGNTLTGAIGIRTTKGRVFTGSSSVTFQWTPRLLIGCEIAGAATQQADLGKAQLQTLGGGTFLLRKGVGLDFAITQGKYEGSPKFGGALGISFDF